MSRSHDGYRHNDAASDRGPVLPERVACHDRDTNIWFPATGQTGAVAVALCRTCPGVRPCREWAIARSWVEGIWGATTPKQRRQARKCRGGQCLHTTSDCPWRLR